MGVVVVVDMVVQYNYRYLPVAGEGCFADAGAEEAGAAADD